jgi:hypothetical protein
MSAEIKRAPIRADWWSKPFAGAVLGATLAFALAGVFAWIGPDGIAAPDKSQFVMWLIAPLWLTVFGFVWLFRTGIQALLWLGGANLLAWSLLFWVRG